MCVHRIQKELLQGAEARLASMTRECSSYEEMKAAFLTSTESNQGQGFWLVSRCFEGCWVSGLGSRV